MSAIRKDLESVMKHDPAARNRFEVILTYSGFHALVLYRFAHFMYVHNYKLVARIVSQTAKFLTGIEIHPGAKIGSGVFIDHGEGVVIGETCIIGSHVKLYQGVTLGAKSFELDEDGNPVKGVKRHPNIEDNVIIYSGATILGGDTTVGANSVIGGNVWLVSSVPAGSKVYNSTPSPTIINK